MLLKEMVMLSELSSTHELLHNTKYNSSIVNMRISEGLDYNAKRILKMY